MDIADFELRIFGNELPYYGVYRQQENLVGHCSQEVLTIYFVIG